MCGRCEAGIGPKCGRGVSRRNVVAARLLRTLGHSPQAAVAKNEGSDCLREYQTGGLRRYAEDLPFEDVIANERTPQRERKIAGHPSIKPQSFLRRLVFASLPLGEGIVADPFMGSGSTIAAAKRLGSAVSEWNDTTITTKWRRQPYRV